MSLILEALKKSEAKRRLGEAPDLGTPFATARRRSSVLPLLLIAIVAAGALGWWFTRAPGPEPGSAAKAPVSPAPATAPKLAATTTHVATAPATPSFDNIAPPSGGAMSQRTRARHAIEPLPAAPVHSGEPPQVVSIAERAQAGGYDGRPQTRLSSKRLPSNMHRVAPAGAPAAPNTTASAPSSTSAPAAASVAAPPSTAVSVATSTAAPPNAAAPKEEAKATPAATAVAPAAVASAPAPVSAPSASAASNTDAPPAPVAPAASVATASVPAPAASTPSDVAKPKLDVPFYYELPFSVRKALPALRLSMHVFASDPAQRFVVLNDSRLAEGDKTSDEVTLREVRRDGAVLEFQGQRFFYPRDGQ